MFYHISDLVDRPDLLELFVTTMDFSLYVSSFWFHGLVANFIGTGILVSSCRRP